MYDVLTVVAFRDQAVEWKKTHTITHDTACFRIDFTMFSIITRIENAPAADREYCEYDSNHVECSDS